MAQPKITTDQLSTPTVTLPKLDPADVMEPAPDSVLVFSDASGALGTMKHGGSFTPVGGGGAAFPNSALGTTASGAITLTDQFQTIVWDNPPDTIVGSDMAMSDDSLSLVFVTGGFYQVVTWVELRPSADASGWVWIQLVSTFMTDPFFDVGSLFEVPIRPESQQPFLTVALPQPPYKVSAGEKLSIHSLKGLSAGSVAISGNSLLFARKIA